jgi:hypothetical protein
MFDGVALMQVLGRIPTMLLPALTPLGDCLNLPPEKSVMQYGKGYPGAQFPIEGPRGPF